MPTGKDLWLTTAPGGTAWQVHASVGSPNGGSLITMKLTTGTPGVLPAVGSTVSYSIHRTGWRHSTKLPATPPWPLRAPAEPAPPPIEAVDGEDAA